MIKLIRYNLEKNLSIALYFFAGIVICAFFNRILVDLNQSIVLEFIAGFLHGLMFGLMIGAALNVIFRFWELFSNDFFGAKAYFYQTLPYRRETLYLSKIYAGIIALAITALVCVFGFWLSDFSFGRLDDFIFVIRQALRLSHAGMWQAAGLAVLLIYLEALWIMMAGMIAIVLANTYTSHPVLMSVVFGFVIYLVIAVVGVSLLFWLTQSDPALHQMLFNGVDFLLIRPYLFEALGIACAYYAVLILAAILAAIPILKRGINVAV